jgi:hypothetical protein
VTAVLAAAWRTEEADGFPHLVPLPSMGVRRFLRYWSTLDEGERQGLREALVSRGTMAFGVLPGALEGAQARAFEGWVNRGLLGGAADGGPGTIPLRLARNMVSAARSDPQVAAMLGNWDGAEIAEVAATESASASALRRVIGPLLRERFGLSAEKGSGGVWTYERQDGLRAQIDYGGRSQLRYWLRVPGRASGFAANLEGTFGLTQDWDWITAAGAEATAGMLAEGIAYVVALGDEIVALG